MLNETPAPAPTVRDLRGLLFAIESQDMTVRELRAALYALDVQDQPATANLLRVVTSA